MDNTRNIDLEMINDLENQVKAHSILNASDALLIEWVFKLTKALYIIARRHIVFDLHDAFGDQGDLTYLVTNRLDEEIRKQIREE